MSFGFYQAAAQRVLDTAIDLLKAPVFAAAGNDGDDEEWYPAAFNLGGITPFAIGGLDVEGNRAEFSNYGNWVEYWQLADPVSSKAYVYDKNGAGKWTESHFSWSGTSFASPIALCRFLSQGGAKMKSSS